MIRDVKLFSVIGLSVVVANAAVLALEIAGARLMMPYLGNTVFVWAGTIAVVLGAMAAGYWWGGRMAQHKSRAAFFLRNALGVAAAAALVPWIAGESVLALLAVVLTSPTLGVWLAALASLVLLAPCVFFLAATSPLALHLTTESLERVGATAGAISALATLGSIAGAIGTALLFLPFFPIDWVFPFVAASLLATAAITHWFVVPAAQHKALHLTLITALVGSVFLPRFLVESSLSSQVVAAYTTPYYRVFVSEGETTSFRMRFLRTGPGGIQCGVLVDGEGTPLPSIILFPYLRAIAHIAESTFRRDEPLHALFVGGCAYTLPFALSQQFPASKTTIVEIDPEMDTIAHKWFGVDVASNPSLTVVHTDARPFLRRDTNRYDLIVLDAFDAGAQIPFPLTTREWFALVRDHLNPSGVVAMNVISAREGPGATLAATIYATMTAMFPHAAAYAITPEVDPTQPQNLLFVAGSADPVARFPAILADEEGSEYPLPLHAERISLPPAPFLLTDRYAPTDYLVGY